MIYRQIYIPSSHLRLNLFLLGVIFLVTLILHPSSLSFAATAVAWWLGHTVHSPHITQPTFHTHVGMMYPPPQ